MDEVDERKIATACDLGRTHKNVTLVSAVARGLLH